MLVKGATANKMVHRSGSSITMTGHRRISTYPFYYPKCAQSSWLMSKEIPQVLLKKDEVEYKAIWKNEILYHKIWLVGNIIHIHMYCVRRLYLSVCLSRFVRPFACLSTSVCLSVNFSFCLLTYLPTLLRVFLISLSMFLFLSPFSFSSFLSLPFFFPSK